jgi:transcriptional regulator with XRE-family HTH domain
MSQTRWEQLRPQRQGAGVSLDMVCLKSGIDRCRLSLAERGLARLSPDQLQRVSGAIDDLGAKKRVINEFAAGIGWPSPARL